MKYMKYFHPKKINPHPRARYRPEGGHWALTGGRPLGSNQRCIRPLGTDRRCIRKSRDSLEHMYVDKTEEGGDEAARRTQMFP